jgi:hypothetical protein
MLTAVDGTDPIPHAHQLTLVTYDNGSGNPHASSHESIIQIKGLFRVFWGSSTKHVTSCELIDLSPVLADRIKTRRY